MQIQATVTQEKQPTATPRVTQEPSHGGTATLVDHRPSTVYQRTLQEAMTVQRSTTVPHTSRRTPQGSSRFRQIATAMGSNYGVDTSGLVATHNSSFPASLNAAATIQGRNIHFAPGMDTEHNIRHEVSHAIDNALHGTPKGDQVVQGHRVDTTREKVVDQMATPDILSYLGRAHPLPEVQGDHGDGPEPLAIKSMADGSLCPVQRLPYSQEQGILDAIEGDLTEKNVNDLAALLSSPQTEEDAVAIAIDVERDALLRLSDERTERGKRTEELIRLYIHDQLKGLKSKLRANSRNATGHLNLNKEEKEQAMDLISGLRQMYDAQSDQDAAIKIRANTPLILYRSIEYANKVDVPYVLPGTEDRLVADNIGSPSGQIRVGDIVADRWFLSTSKHREFFSPRSDFPASREGGPIVHFVIYARSGVPISMRTPPPQNVIDQHKSMEFLFGIYTAWGDKYSVTGKLYSEFVNRVMGSMERSSFKGKQTYEDVDAYLNWTGGFNYSGFISSRDANMGKREFRSKAGQAEILFRPLTRFVVRGIRRETVTHITDDEGRGVDRPVIGVVLEELAVGMKKDDDVRDVFTGRLLGEHERQDSVLGTYQSLTYDTS